MSTPPTSDTSSPSVEIVSDDAGNLDGSWLNANYPPFPPKRAIAFDLCRTLTKNLTYSVGAGAVPQYRDAKGFVVPAQTDMVGNLLPRFQHGPEGNCHGLLIEPASTNHLEYDRLGLSSGVTFTGCAAGSATRLSVDGISQISAVVNTSTNGGHGIALRQIGPLPSPMSLSFALFSATQRYYVVNYNSAMSAVLDTQALTLTALTGNPVGRVYVDQMGWVWVSLQLGSLNDLDIRTISIQCANDAIGTVSYIDPGTTWFFDAAQLENCEQPTSPMFAQPSSLVSRGAEVVQTVMPQYNPDNWLDVVSGSGSVIVEGYLPSVIPAANVIKELWRFALDAQHFLVVGYTTALRANAQLGLYLTNGTGVTNQILAISGTLIAADSYFKVGVSYTSTAGALSLTGFAVNGKSALAVGQIGGALPTGLMQTLNFSTCNLPLIISKLIGYDQPLTINQLKYLTAV
jgi:hypothetical protein